MVQKSFMANSARETTPLLAAASTLPPAPAQAPPTTTTRGTAACSWTQIAKGASAFALLAFLGLAIGLSLGLSPLGPPHTPLTHHVNVSHVVTHLRNLEAIATSDPHNGGSRSSTRGFNASAQYVVDFLRNHTDYDVWVQPVVVQDQTDGADPVLIAHGALNGSLTRNYSAYTDILAFRGSTSGSLENSLAFHIMGCDPVNDLAVFATRRMAVAVIPVANPAGRSPDPRCPNYCARAVAAIKAGAKGVIFYPSPLTTGYPIPLAPFVGRCPAELLETMGTVPALMTSQAAGFDLLQRVVAPEGLRVTLKTDTRYGPVTVMNVLAETKTGSDDSVVFMTAHLDSVPAGPGVNDDGSGSMATLELAHALYRSGLYKYSTQKVRFGWWCAEETGLQGSRYYVDDLAKRDNEALYRIKLNIDTDMIASPNYVRGVWDGRGVADPRITKAATVIQEVFESYFASQGLPTVPFAFNGRSDFVAFMDVGIPAGGVITGEDEIKTHEQAELFGGIAGMVLDPCYHQRCDTVESLRGPGIEVLGQNLKALAFAMQRFAMEEDLETLLQGRKPI